MTEYTTLNKVLVREQDVTNISARKSICESLLLMAQSMVAHKNKTLIQLPREKLLGANNLCKCYPCSACEEWAMDEDYVRERLLDPNYTDYESVTSYIMGIINDGPTGDYCIWIDGKSCVWGECHNE